LGPRLGRHPNGGRRAQATQAGSALKQRPAALLGDRRHGHWQIAPATDVNSTTSVRLSQAGMQSTMRTTPSAVVKSVSS
jgi:hypothetical protein